MITLNRRQLELAMCGLIAYQKHFPDMQGFFAHAIALNPKNAPVLPTKDEVTELGDLFVSLLDAE